MAKNQRIIKLKSIRNLRTLAGLTGADGRRIKENILLRSAALSTLTAEDRKVLTEQYGLTTVVDLRTEDEVRKAPDLTEGLIYNYLPICRDTIPGVSREAEPGKHVTIEMLPDLRDMYRDVVSGEEFIEAFSLAVKTIIHHRDGAILWHCTEGKDRCGLTAMFVLSVLGVSEAQIIEDYMLTNLSAKKKARKTYFLIRFLKRDKALAQKVHDVYIVDEEYIGAAIAAINEKFGGMDRYIHEKLGISDEEISEFREYALM